VGLVSVADRPAQVAEHPQPRKRRWVAALVPFLYVLLAVGITLRLWLHPSTIAPYDGVSGISRDVYLNAWFMRYTAMAVSHGQLPALVTNAVNFPQGVSAMWNTSMLLPAVLLSPVTLLAGPMVSLTTMLTLAFAGSATAMFVVLRRWGLSIGAAGVGGALYAFSPAVLVAAQDHYHLQFAILPPLIVDAVLRLVTRRGHPVRAGIWLGLLVTGQIFIAEELLADTALACVVILLMLAVCQPARLGAAVRKPLPSARKFARPAGGFAVALGIVVALAGHALWVQFHGPLAEQGSPWHIWQYGSQPADFVTAPTVTLLHGSQFWAFLQRTGQFFVETFAYLSWPVLALLVLVTVLFWRDLRMRVLALSFAVLELLSMGGHRIHVGHWYVPFYLQPWHWLWHLPVIGEMVPNRIAIVADGVAAAMLALAIDAARAAVPRGRSRRIPILASAALIGLAALIPIIPRAVVPAPIDPIPAAWSNVINGLHPRPGAAVLVLPVDGAMAMEWQAVTGESIKVVGGYCIVRQPNGHASQCDTKDTLSTDQQTALLRFNLLARYAHGARGPSSHTTASAISDWRPDYIVSIAGGSSPLGGYLISVLGPPTITQDNVLGWKVSKSWLSRELGVHAPPWLSGRLAKLHSFHKSSGLYPR